MGAAQVSLCEIGAVEIGVAEVYMCKVGFTEIWPGRAMYASPLVPDLGSLLK